MRKYHALWEWLAANGSESITLSFDEIAEHAGVPLDHSFLTYKKELLAYGYAVKKISMKAQAVTFCRISPKKDDK